MTRIVVIALFLAYALVGGALQPNSILPAYGQLQKANVTQSMEDCEKTCRSCAKVCEDTLAYCKTKGGEHNNPKHLNTLKDCIQACQLSANFLNRGSERHTKSCAFCAEICKDCAASCDAFKDDKKMKACADECRKCAESCTKMAAMK